MKDDEKKIELTQKEKYSLKVCIADEILAVMSKKKITHKILSKNTGASIRQIGKISCGLLSVYTIKQLELILDAVNRYIEEKKDEQ
jgi:hypothetical protein